jgi:hypothetical protein
MPWWLAIRDNDAQKPVSVTDVDEKTMEKAYADARRKYPPPQYEIVLAVGQNLEGFYESYPRFKGAPEGGKGPAAPAAPAAPAPKGPA